MVRHPATNGVFLSAQWGAVPWDSPVGYGRSSTDGVARRESWTAASSKGHAVKQSSHAMLALACILSGLVVLADVLLVCWLILC